MNNGAEYFGVDVATSPGAASNWETTFGGGMTTAGVGGPITGKGADLLIIDDPIKNFEEAHSKRIRESVWNWFLSTAYTRLAPDGAAIVIQTRWHTDDLIGRLRKGMEGGGEKWRVLDLPAIGADGSALWEDRYSINHLQGIRTALGSYKWSALYQQSPRPDGGSYFKPEWLPIIGSFPAEAKDAIRYWDKAGSSTDGDFSTGVLMVRFEGVFYIVDVVRGRWSPFERNKVIAQTAELDRLKFGGRCQLWIEQEPGNGGKESAMISQRELARYGVRIDKPHDGKDIRARPFAAQCEAQNVRLVGGEWTGEYIDELTAFPNGEHDDQVDASSGAFNKLMTAAAPVAFSRPVSHRTRSR